MSSERQTAGIISSGPSLAHTGSASIVGPWLPWPPPVATSRGRLPWPPQSGSDQAETLLAVSQASHSGSAFLLGRGMYCAVGGLEEQRSEGKTD